MKLSLTVVVLVLMQLSHVNVSTALSPICIERVPYYTAISYPTLYTARFITSYHECGHSWVRIRCPRIRNPVISKIAYKRIQLFSIRKFCCDGYRGTPPICKAICSQGCHNGGTCVSPGTCICRLGWAGNDCRTPICLLGCLNGGTCVSPGTCRCSRGWTGINCIIPICSQGCHNGACVSPDTCICLPGWKGNDCSTPICLLGCLNGGTCVSPGTCSCSRGWRGIICIIPICLLGCYNGGTCTRPGTCFCLFGWIGNDCRKPICSQGCYNRGTCSRPGICSCRYGWTGNNCRTPFCLQGCYNGGTCTSPSTCTCKAGWTGSNCRTDVNECSKSTTCGPNQRCINTVGSYRCECVTGYMPDPALRIGSGIYRGCKDINECSGLHQCSQNCINQPGSYICSCRNGYILNANGRECSDIDECSDRNAGCIQKCVNTPGSYHCGCNSGYELLPDKHNCSDIMECQDGLHNCSQKCIELDGGFSCACNDGYLLLNDGVSCEDKDECEEGTSRCQQLCMNTIGSYQCGCQAGFYLLPDKLTCADTDECNQDNGGCDQICNNTIGSYECSCRDGYELEFNGINCTSKPCPPLMRPRNGRYVCDGPQVTGAICSFECNHGYILIGSKERECLSSNKWSGNTSSCEILHCEELHNPTNGNVILPCATKLGTTCKISCSPGFYTNSTNSIQQCESTDNQTAVWSMPPECIDIDECNLDNGGCEHICNNTFGSYECYCRDDYELEFNEKNCTVNCPPGKYQVSLPEIVDEEDGRVAHFNISKCIPCPQGRYQDQQGHSSCKKCPPGYTTLTTGTRFNSSCVMQCSPGTFSYNGIEPCMKCPNGTHSISVGSTSCFNCSDESKKFLGPVDPREKCQHFCKNQSTCACHEGYILSSDGYTCMKCAKILTNYDNITGLSVLKPTWHVTLCNSSDQESNTLICSGSLLNDQWVITSAKCVCSADFNKDLLSLRLNKSQSCLVEENHEFNLSMLEVYCHPNHNTSDEEMVDLALIKIKNPIPAEKLHNTLPLCLHDSNNPVYYRLGKLVTYGLRSSFQRITTLTAARLSVSASSECFKRFSEMGIKYGHNDKTFCMHASTASRCVGNPGSAVITFDQNGKITFAGVISRFTKVCGEPNSYIANTKIQSADILKWIDEIIENQ